VHCAPRAAAERIFDPFFSLRLGAVKLASLDVTVLEPGLCSASPSTRIVLSTGHSASDAIADPVGAGEAVPFRATRWGPFPGARPA